MKESTMRDVDPIIGIRRFREEFAAEHNYDIRAMSATLQRISDERGHVTIPPPDEASGLPVSAETSRWDVDPTAPTTDSAPLQQDLPVVGGSAIV